MDRTVCPSVMRTQGVNGPNRTQESAREYACGYHTHPSRASICGPKWSAWVAQNANAVCWAKISVCRYGTRNSEVSQINEVGEQRCNGLS